MKVFVTVGTTHFDRLIRAVLEDPYLAEQDCVLQVGPGGLQPDQFESFEYTPDINAHYEWADVVITHAGAGSIYQLLGMGKRLVIVPNLDRLDKHQTDIADYMHSNGHALRALPSDDLGQVVQRAATEALVPFERDAFFAADEILSFIAGS